MNPKFYGMVSTVDRRFHLLTKDKERWEKYTKEIMIPGKRYIIVVKEEEKYRTNNQNRYAHGVIFRMYADFAGFQTVTDARKFLERKFSTVPRAQAVEQLLESYSGKLDPEEYRQVLERILPEEIVKEYKNLTTKEAEIFHDKCRQLAAEFGFYIPEPNEVEGE